MTNEERTALENYARELSGREPSNAEAGTNDAPALETVSAAELQRMDIPPLQWVVERILPQGLTILAAPPKYGKSWLALDLCASVALGRPFLGFQTTKAEVLYMALEDGHRRLKTRLTAVLEGREAPDNLHFAIASLALDNGLAEQLFDFVQKHPCTRLIVIDVLARIRSNAVSRRNDVYRLDYHDAAVLQGIAQKYGIAIVVIHHARKMRDETDVYNAISGSNGLFGGADGAWILQRGHRDDLQTSFYINGREVASECYKIAFDDSICRWRMLGDAAEMARNAPTNDPVFDLVRALLRKYPEGWKGTAAQMLAEGAGLVDCSEITDPRSIGKRLPGIEARLLDSGIRWTKQTRNGVSMHSFRRNAPLTLV